MYTVFDIKRTVCAVMCIRILNRLYYIAIAIQYSGL